MFFRLIITSFLVYLGYRLFKGLRTSEPDKSSVRGKPKKEPLDLQNSDVEDAQFKEIDDSGS